MTFAALGLLMIVAFIAFYRKGFGLTFFYDEWAFVLDRRAWTIDTFLEPHGEHLSILPILVFKLLFVTVGLDDYWVYRVTTILAHLLCVLLIFVYARRRLGDILALCAAVPILFLGAAWQAILWPFVISFPISVAAGIGMLLALDRKDRRGDVIASLLLATSIASSSLGIPFAVAAFVELGLTRESWRRLWLVVVPLLLYGAWVIAYGPEPTPGAEDGLLPLFRENIPNIPAHMATAVAGAVGGLTGLGLDWGRPLALLAGIALGLRIAGHASIPVRALAILIGAISFWGLMALFRAQLNTPVESRYLYPGAVFIVLIAVELARGARVSSRGLVLIAIVLAAAAVANFGLLRSGSQQLQEHSSYVAPELGALEIAGPGTDPSYRPDPVRAPVLTAGPYFDAIHDLGSPADTAKEIRRRPDPQRQAADNVLLQALGVRLRPARDVASTSSAPDVEAAVAGTTSKDEHCIAFAPSVTGAAVDLRLPPTGVIISPQGSATTEIRLRHFAQGFPSSAYAAVPAGSTQILRVPARRDASDWHLRLTPTGPVQACGGSARSLS